jgi:Xaa-Pro aminopeptidase
MAKKQKKQLPPPKKRRAPRRPQVPPEVSSARKYKAWEMRVINPHMTFRQITEELNKLFPEYPLESDHQAVEKMIKSAEQEYIQAHQTQVDSIKAESALTMDWVRAEAADAWDKSKDMLRTLKKREDQTVEQILKANAGNAQFLKTITESVVVKAKLYGALAPKRHEVTGKNGAPLVPPGIDIKALRKYLSDDDLDILQQAAEIIERAQLDLATAVQEGDRSGEADSES